MHDPVNVLWMVNYLSHWGIQIHFAKVPAIGFVGFIGMDSIALGNEMRETEKNLDKIISVEERSVSYEEKNTQFIAVNTPIEYCSIWEKLPKVDTSSENFINLLKNIAKNGQSKPIAVFKDGEGDNYKIINGRKRYEIAKRLGKSEIYVVVVANSPNENNALHTILNENKLKKQKIDYRFEGCKLGAILDSGAFDSASDLANRLEIKKSSLSKILALKSLPDGMCSLFGGWENVSLRFGYKITTLLSSDQKLKAFNAALEETDKDDSITDKQTMLLASLGAKPMVCTRPFKNKLGNVLATENTKNLSLTIFEPEIVRELKKLLKCDDGMEKLKKLLIVKKSEAAL